MARKYQAYLQYKNSEIEWLDKVPIHWKRAPIKYLALKKDSLFIDGNWIESKDLSSEGIRYITTGNVGEGCYKEQGEGYITEEKFQQINCTEVFTGDVLISRLNNPIGRACVVPNLNSRIVTSVDNVIFRPDSDFLTKYLVYMFSSKEYFMHTSNISRGATMQRISRGLLGNIRVVFPPVDEQNKIINFLDHETAKIDTLIEKQQQLIKLLKEKRQAVISHAVTKGLSSLTGTQCPMRDSGVEWLGEVPAHWKLVPLKYLCTFYGGGTPSKENLDFWTNGNIPWVSPKDMKSFWVSDAQDKITEKAVKESSTNFVESGALLMVVRSGILQRTIPIAINTVKLTLNQDMKALKFNSRLNVEYAANYILGNVDSLLLEWSKEGATVESIEHEYLSSSVFPVPPIEEQIVINEEIRKRMNVFQSLEEYAVNGIALLKERRTALISAAVTGKIDVRNWKAPKLSSANKDAAA